MFLEGLRENQNVITVYIGKSFDKVLQLIIDTGLNTAGALGRLKGITRYWKWPERVLKAIFHSSPSRILMRWSLFKWSILEKVLSLWSGSNAEEINNSGYVFLWWYYLTPIVNTGHWCLTFLRNKEKNLPQGEKGMDGYCLQWANLQFSFQWLSLRVIDWTHGWWEEELRLADPW